MLVSDSNNIESGFEQKTSIHSQQKGSIPLTFVLTLQDGLKIYLKWLMGLVYKNIHIRRMLNPPELTASDYHLFSDLDVLWLTSRKKVEHELVLYFISKPKEFYKHGIYKLDRWNKFIRSNGWWLNISRCISIFICNINNKIGQNFHSSLIKK